MSKRAQYDNAKKRIYADYAAATPVDRSIMEEMALCAEAYPGNPSSMHSSGREARSILDHARGRVARLLATDSDEILFTGGGSESDNLALFGVMRAPGAKQKHLIVSSVEHKAVLESARALRNEGFEVTIVPVDATGRVAVNEVLKSVRDDTALISIMYVNNELGTVQPICDIAEAVGERRARTGFPLFHTDACQAAGFFPLAPRELGVDLLSLNGSKIYGPRGVGVLYRRSDVSLAPLIVGGEHEYGLRAGTENLPAIVGMARALEEVERARAGESARLLALRNRFIRGLVKRIPEVIIDGNREHAAPHITHVTVPAVEGESMLLMLDQAGIEVATGSACSTSDLRPSHVLTAIGQPEELIHGSLRFSFGKHTAERDIDHILNVFPPIVAVLKNTSVITTRQYARQ